MDESPKSRYDPASQDWRRNEPILVSDFTAMPFLLDWCEPVKDLAVLDLGCGEGYFARSLKQRGAGPIQAMDLSDEMVSLGAVQEESEPLGIEYSCGDATDLSRFDSESFDLVVAVFLFDYLDVEQSAQTMREVARVLRPGGQFIFAVPHPSLPFLRPEEPPLFFAHGSNGYYSGRNLTFEGEIWGRDGRRVPLRCVHKTLQDYFECLHAAGFTSLPELRELRVTDEICVVDPEFFTPLLDQPLHLAIRLEKH